MQRILIIDDEEGVRETLGVFAEMLGYEPILAEDVTSCDAIHSANQSCDKEKACADILLIDQHLGSMTGLEFIEQQMRRGCKAAVNCKAIISGALTDEEFRLAHDLGCYVLQKPVTFEILEGWLSSIQQVNNQAAENDLLK
jgi:DNA-binding response OmpR family regulator